MQTYQTELNKAVQNGIERSKAMRQRKARRDDIIGLIVVTTYCALIASLTVCTIVTLLDFKVL
jgi:hypothetical protein